MSSQGVALVFITSDVVGAVFALDPYDNSTLICGSLYEDCTFDTSLDEWVEVDYVELHEAESEAVVDEVGSIHKQLLSMRAD